VILFLISLYYYVIYDAFEHCLMDAIEHCLMDVIERRKPIEAGHERPTIMQCIYIIIMVSQTVNGFWNEEESSSPYYMGI
jgi:hypothetical protein